MPTYEHAAFLFPVIKGQIYLAQRNTEPHKGMYGPVGGKIGASRGKTLRPQLITKPGGHMAESLVDTISLESGNELPSEAALREFYEEVFSGITFQEGDITDIFRLGTITDYVIGKPELFLCRFHLANIHRTDFNLSPRELSDFRPITEVDPEKIFNIGKIALIQLKWMLEAPYTDVKYVPFMKHNLHEQIPEFSKVEPRPLDDMVGAGIFYHDKNLWEQLHRESHVQYFPNGRTNFKN